MPAAMRRARLSVLPDPAPASTRRLTSRSRSMRSRAFWSGKRLRSVMRGQAPIRIERPVRDVLQLEPGPVVRIAATGTTEVTPLAIVLVGAMNERTRGEDVEQIAQDGAGLGCGDGRQDDSLAPAPRGRQIVAARADA